MERLSLESVLPDSSQGLWLGLAVVFFAFFLLHLWRAFQSIQEPPELRGAVKEIIGVSTGVPELEGALRSYIRGFNRDSRVANLVAAGGYLITALTALFSHSL